MLLRLLLLACFAGVFSALLHSQTASPRDNGPRVFKANARIVVLDVVVTGKNRRSLTGLHKEDFRVREDGHPQAITYFEEHSGAQQPLEAEHSDQPPNLFSNVPQVKVGDSVTVLVLDSLNTPLEDQRFVRAQTLKYLKTLQPGRRIAIFTLGTQLRFIQGFTDDPALLMGAINNPENGVGRQISPLLQTNAETVANQETIAATAVHAADAAAAMREFWSEQISTRSGVRIGLTLQALQELAHYLGGIPGRKNVVWFSGAFPSVIFPNPEMPDAFGAQRDDQEEVRKTNDLLASAQIAVYPVAAEGLVTDSAYSASIDARQAEQASRPRRDDAEERNANHASMQVIAQATGGEAFYNTNGLVDALNRVAEHASYFYTLTYTSANQATDGRFRKIQVDLANKPGYRLAYRRGYFADDAKGAQPSTSQPTPKPVVDRLSPLLHAGLPDSTEVPFMVRVVRGSAPPRAAPALTGRTPAGIPGQGGDNSNLKGPLTRYKVDFLINASGLRFDPVADGRQHVSVETGLVVYNRDGKPLNWMLRQVNLNLDATQYKAAQTNGVNLYLEIDAPDEGVRMESGVYDLNSNLAGTTAVPLNTIVSSAPEGSPKQR